MWLYLIFASIFKVTTPPKKYLYIAIVATMLLSACGGGGGTDTQNPDTEPPQTNTAPTIAGSPPINVVEGSEYRFEPTANDTDASDTLSFVVSNKPTWADFDPVTGILSGTPTKDHVGINQNIVISVSDGIDTVSLPAFNLTVSAVSVTNNAPIANAGVDQSVTAGQMVTLSASGSSDPDGDALSYAWMLSSQPQGSAVTLDTTNALTSQFTPTVAGEYIIQLIVNDGLVDSAASTIKVTANSNPNPINRPPIAIVEPVTNVSSGRAVTLNGSASSDPDNDALSYQWSLQSQPSSSTATLNNPDNASANFTPDMIGDYILRLVVNDGLADSVPSDITITANNYDPATDQGVFLWQGQGGQWQLRATAGGVASTSYSGSITSSGGFSNVQGVRNETDDTLDSTGDSINFTLNVGGEGVDGIDFLVKDGVSACFESLDNPPVFVGSGRTQVTPPFDLATLGPCKKPLDLEALGYLDITDPRFGAIANDPNQAAANTLAIQKAIDLSNEQAKSRAYNGVANFPSSNWSGRHGYAIYFPPGTYYINDTLNCMQPGPTRPFSDVDFGHNEFQGGCVLIGSTSGSSRPVIRLHDNSYTDPNQKKAVVHFWRQQRSTENGVAGSIDPALEDGSRSYNQVIRNIDIDLGSGNPGAVGLRHYSAEGSAIQEVRINARNSFAGVYNFPASGGTVIDLEVVGGKYGIYAPKARGGANLLVGIRLSGQSLAPIYYNAQHPLTVVGFDIKHTSGPINAFAKDMALIDGTIEITNNTSGTVLANSNGRSVYMKNVSIKGAGVIVNNGNQGPNLTANAASWTNVEEYSFVNTSNNLFDAVLNGNRINNKPVVEKLSTLTNVPSADALIAQHVYPEKLCSFEDSSAVNVMDFGAKGDGTTNDTAALKAAIAASDKVLLPRGRYIVNETIALKSTTQLCGIGSVLSVIQADPNWNTSAPNFTPILRTPNDASARVVLDSLQTRTLGTAKRIYHLHWQSGRDSILKNVTPATKGPWPGSFDIPLVRTQITGNGGGRWYGYLSSTSWDCMHSGCRILKIDGTREPLAIYMLHTQYLKVSGGPMTEVNNAQNVSFYAQKSENIIPEELSERRHRDNFGTPWPILMTIKNASDIALYSAEGPTQAEVGRGLYELYDSNVTLVNVARRQGPTHVLDNLDPNVTITEKDWYFVTDSVNGSILMSIDADGVLGFFRRDDQ